jgi:hypothetical protein
MSSKKGQDANITKLILAAQNALRGLKISEKLSAERDAESSISDDSDWKSGSGSDSGSDSDDSDWKSGNSDDNDDNEDSDDSDFQAGNSDDSEENDAESGDNSVSIDSNHVNNKPVGRNWSTFLDGGKSEQELEFEKINKLFKKLVERELLKNTGEQQLLEELTTISNEPTVISQPHSHTSSASKTEEEKLLEELKNEPTVISQPHSHTSSASKTEEEQKLLEELTNITTTHSQAHSHASTVSKTEEEQKFLKELINLPTIARPSLKHNSTSTETLELEVGPDCPFRLGQLALLQITDENMDYMYTWVGCMLFIAFIVQCFVIKKI